MLLVPTTSYRIADFLDAAERLGVPVTVGSDQRHVLESLDTGATIELDFTDADAALARIEAFHHDHPLAAVVGVDEETVLVAARAAEALGLSHNPPAAVITCGNKHAFRTRLANSGLLAPRFSLLATGDDPDRAAARSFYPAVLKPLSLSAGRGVIRADDPEQFAQAFRRITSILETVGGANPDSILVEEYVEGDEVAVEGLLSGGRLQVLALFDKPDPLVGPTFEETLYVTPSRHDAAVQRAVADAVAAAIAAVGLREGPVHAEARINGRGVWVIEIAARSIGGQCARSLRFGAGVRLEELILKHALGTATATPGREDAAAGVMMMPIPAAGTLVGVDGVDAARAHPGIEDVTVTIPVGETLVPLPDGNRYLGFIFARADAPAAVEAALRQAHAELVFTIDPGEGDQAS